MHRRTTLAALCVGMILVMAAPPVSANPVQKDIVGGGGVIEPGEVLVLFQFHVEGDQLHLDMDWWFGVESEEETEGVPSDCHYAGNTDTNSELGYVERGTSLLVTIDGPAEMGCNDGEYVLAELEVIASPSDLLTEPILTSDGSLCRGVRRTTNGYGTARAYIEAQGFEPQVVIDVTGQTGSGSYGAETWVCLGAE